MRILGRVGLVVTVFLLVWGTKLMTVDRYGTDLPYWDQWAKEGELFYAPWFERHEFWKNVFVPHNEHRIAPTLAMNLGLLCLGSDQWDARVQCAASAALHAALAAGLAAWALRRFRSRWAVTAIGVIVLMTAPPIAWENVLGGFQSQFYFLAIFSLLAIAGLLGASAGSWRWLGGIVAAVLAQVSMGSGMLAAVSVAAVAVLRVIEKLTSSDERRRGPGPHEPGYTVGPEMVTLVAALVIGGVGWWLRPQAPWHATIHAHSLAGCLTYAVRCLSWPCYGWPWLSVVLWAPWLVMGVRRVSAAARGFSHTTNGRDLVFVDIVLAGGLWVMLQAVAVSYSRAGASEMPAPRYGDIFALGVVFSFFALALLCGEADELPKAQTTAVRAGPPYLKTAAGVWIAVLAVGIFAATRAALEGPLPAKKADAVAYERNVQAFVLTDDYAQFEKQLPLLPFPSAEWLAKILRNPTLRRLLPASVREPVQVRGLAHDSHAGGMVPPLLNRATRMVTTPADWRSATVTPGRGWWKIETAGDVGRPGVVLELRAAEGGRTLAKIQPTKPAGNSWRAAYVHAPQEPAVIFASVSNPAHTVAFSEPVEMSSLSFWTWRLAEHATWLAVFAAIGAAGFGYAAANEDQP